ncbi:MAG: hypothetical protein GY884_29560, partial [Proteobacteria bacterium]|nr:hypothetical protein [Pseudomonadota bacterium]
DAVGVSEQDIERTLATCWAHINELELHEDLDGDPPEVAIWPGLPFQEDPEPGAPTASSCGIVVLGQPGHGGADLVEVLVGGGVQAFCAPVGKEPPRSPEAARALLGGAAEATLVVSMLDGPMPWTAQHCEWASLAGIPVTCLLMTDEGRLDDEELAELVVLEAVELLDHEGFGLDTFDIQRLAGRPGGPSDVPSRISQVARAAAVTSATTGLGAGLGGLAGLGAITGVLGGPVGVMTGAAIGAGVAGLIQKYRR